MKYRSTLNSPVSNQKIIRLIEELESKRTKKEIELNRDLVEFDIQGNETNLELYSIVVEKDYRGIGIGTEAVKKIIELSKKYGFYDIEVKPLYENIAKLSNFYLQLGFEKKLDSHFYYVLNEIETHKKENIFEKIKKIFNKIN